ncbi:MAG: hypothetical protein ACE5GW_06895, partial [Planctomycetota bacterium]
GRPCFRCYLPALPDAGTMASCESAGILPAASSSAAVTVVAQVMRWVSGRALAPAGERLFIRGNVIRGTRSRSTLLPDPACPTCGEERVILDGSSDLAPRKVCGKEQIEGWLRIPVGEAKRRLRAATEGGPGRLRETLGALRLDSPAGWVVLFPDGRVLTGPSASPEAARRRLEVILGPGCLH